MVMTVVYPRRKLQTVMISARVIEWPTRKVLEARWVFKASSALFNAEIVASSPFTKQSGMRKKKQVSYPECIQIIFKERV